MKLHLFIASIVALSSLTGIAADITPEWNNLSLKEFNNQILLRAAAGKAAARITTERTGGESPESIPG